MKETPVVVAVPEILVQATGNLEAVVQVFELTDIPFIVNDGEDGRHHQDSVFQSIESLQAMIVH